MISLPVSKKCKEVELGQLIIVSSPLDLKKEKLRAYSLIRVLRELMNIKESSVILINQMRNKKWVRRRRSKERRGLMLMLKLSQEIKQRRNKYQKLIVINHANLNTQRKEKVRKLWTCYKNWICLVDSKWSKMTVTSVQEYYRLIR